MWAVTETLPVSTGEGPVETERHAALRGPRAAFEERKRERFGSSAQSWEWASALPVLTPL
jgi:hypothetical protein